MKIESKIPTSTRGAQLRSAAQEKRDAAGGEKIAAQQAHKTAEAHKARYTDAVEARKALLDDAQQLRAEAAEKLRGAVGPRGVFALENVARGFASLMNKLAGKTFVTVESMKADPAATATAARLEKLAASKEAEAKAQLEVATRSWALSTEALAKAGGHEQTAAAHTEAAARLMKQAKNADQFAHTAEQLGSAAKKGFETLAGAVGGAVKDVVREEARALGDLAKKELGKLGDEVRSRAREDLRGLLLIGIDFLKSAVDAFFGAVEEKSAPAKPSPESAPARKAAPRKPTQKKQPASPPTPEQVKEAVKKAEPHLPAEAKAQLQDLGFSPGTVAFTPASSAEPEPIKLKGPRIDEPPRGEKKISESFLAARWAAEAAGIDWVGKGAGELKKLIESHKGGLKLSHGASPFEAKKRLAERMGMPTKSEAVHAMEIDMLREAFAKREAIGLPRLSTQTEFNKALTATGLAPDAPLDALAMAGVAKGAQDLGNASKALKADLENADKQAAFDKAAAALDASKKVMLDVIAALPAGDRRYSLALDACDAVEVAHGKPGATTKLGATLEKLLESPGFVAVAQKSLGVAAEDWKATSLSALQASVWTTLGELGASSGALGYPGPLTDAQRKESIAPLPRVGTLMAKELALLDDAGIAALEKHTVFTGTEPASAQLLGLARQLSELAEHRDARTQEKLSPAEILTELERNAGLEPMVGRDGKLFLKDPPTLSPGLVKALEPHLGEVLKSLR